MTPLDGFSFVLGDDESHVAESSTKVIIKVLLIASKFHDWLPAIGTPVQSSLLNKSRMLGKRMEHVGLHAGSSPQLSLE